MKKILLTLLSLAIVPAVFAQGSFFYNNFTAAGGTGFVLYNGNPAPTGFSVDIYWGAIGADVSTFQALGNAVPVGVLDLGYYDGGTAVIPAGAATPSVQIQYRVVTAGYTGSSGIVTQPLAYAPSTPTDAVLPASWNIVAVPEPSMMALASLGGAAMLMFRRRNV